jgi:uncharacterized membrane protein YGL010W
MNPDEGIFQWKRRMGIHLAYHTSFYNQCAHVLTVPLELMGVIALLGGLAPWLTDPCSYASWSSFAVILLIGGTVYVRVDLLCGILFTTFLLALQAPVFWFMGLFLIQGWWRVLFGLALFVVFNILESLAHKYLEPDGRDDSEILWPEFFRTYDVVPLLLVYYFNCMEILFQMGYKPSVRKEVLYFRDTFRFPSHGMSKQSKVLGDRW